MKFKKITAYMLMLLSASYLLSSSNHDDEDEFGDLPDTYPTSVARTSNRWAEFADKTKPALQALVRTTTCAAQTTAKVIVGAYCGAVAAISDGPFEECPTCHQQTHAFVTAPIIHRNHSNDTDSDFDTDDKEFELINVERPRDLMSEEFSNKSAIMATDQATLLQKINNYVQQTYTHDRSRLQEQAIQERVHLLIKRAQERSETTGQDVSISKQIATIYAPLQEQVLEKQLHTSSCIEQAAQIEKETKIKLAEIERARSIERAEKKYGKAITQYESSYKKKVTKELTIASIFAFNTQHLFKQAEQESPAIAQPQHYENIEKFQKHLAGLRPKIRPKHAATDSTSSKK